MYSSLQKIQPVCPVFSLCGGCQYQDISYEDELRVKETDRIQSMVITLKSMGAKIHSEGNTLIIDGPTPLKGATVNSYKDHRTAMSLLVAGMVAEGQTQVRDVECINTSFPIFFDLLSQLGIVYQLQS